MSDWLHIVGRDEVVDPVSFGKYCAQHLGAPYPSVKDMTILRKGVKEFFEQYPKANYSTLLKLVDLAVTQKKRFSHVYKIIDWHRYPYEKGLLPELDGRGVNVALEDSIYDILDKDSDYRWHARFNAERSPEGRAALYQQYMKEKEYGQTSLAM
jgi:hypothetical protein